MFRATILVAALAIAAATPAQAGIRIQGATDAQPTAPAAPDTRFGRPSEAGTVCAHAVVPAASDRGGPAQVLPITGMGMGTALCAAARGGEGGVDPFTRSARD